MEGFNTNQPAGATSPTPFVQEQQFLSPHPDSNQQQFLSPHPDSNQQEQQFLSPHPDSTQQQFLSPHPDSNQSQPISSGDGVSSSSNRRPRGRPPGSKNRPKTPVIVRDTAPNTLQPVVIEIFAGADIMEFLKNYARATGKGFCILSADGMVSNVNIRDPATSGVLTLRGSYNIISLTGALLPPPAPPGFSGLSILLSAGEGHVLGGKIVGPLVATESVILVTASFAHAVYERLPVQVQAAEGNAGGRVQPLSSGVTVGASTLPLFRVERNVAPPTPAHAPAPSQYASAAPPPSPNYATRAPPPASPYAFPADFIGYGGCHASPRPSF